MKPHLKPFKLQSKRNKTIDVIFFDFIAFQHDNEYRSQMITWLRERNGGYSINTSTKTLKIFKGKTRDVQDMSPNKRYIFRREDGRLLATCLLDELQATMEKLGLSQLALA